MKNYHCDKKNHFSKSFLIFFLLLSSPKLCPISLKTSLIASLNADEKREEYASLFLKKSGINNITFMTDNAVFNCRPVSADGFCIVQGGNARFT